MSALRVLFRVDAGESLGLGHLARCKALMVGLSTATECTFVIATSRRGLVRGTLGSIDAAVRDTNLDRFPERFDLVVVDLPDARSSEQRRLRQLGRVLVCIDDEGYGIPNQDIMIRPSLEELPKPSSVSGRCRWWSGKEYVILHPLFGEQAKRRRDRCGAVERLLVCFGGSDPSKLTLRVVPLLQQQPDGFAIHIVLGAAFEWQEAVHRLVDNDRRFEVSFSLPDMAAAFWKCDLAVISGGTLIYEACSLGVPAIVISQNRAQAEEAMRLQGRGAVLSLGSSASVSDDAILHAVRRLVVDDSARTSMSESASLLGLADGTERIVSQLIRYLSEKTGE